MGGGETDGPARLAQALAARRLVLFDLDDTLCDYSLARDRRLCRAFTDAFAASGLTVPADLAPLVAGSIAANPHGVDHFPDLLAPHGVTDAAIAAAQTWYRTNRFHGLAFFGATHDAITAVRRQPGVTGRRIGLITNGPADVQRAKVELLGVGALVDAVVISGEFGVEKPDPAIFHEALRRLGGAPHEAVYVGDSAEHDVAGARAAGLEIVWVNRHGAPWVGDGPEPGLWIRDIGDLARAIPAGR